MLHIALIDPLALPMIEAVANRLLRFLGGPDHVPHRNEDFVWF